MKFDPILINQLRDRAAAGSTPCSMAEWIGTWLDADEAMRVDLIERHAARDYSTRKYIHQGTYVVLKYFMEAFRLSLADVVDLRGAPVFQGGVLERGEIDDWIMAKIQSTSHFWKGVKYAG